MEDIGVGKDSIGNRPVSVEIQFHLEDFGINKSDISSNTVTMQSDKYICVRVQEEDNKSLVTINANTKQHDKKRIKADSAIMHPVYNVIALRGIFYMLHFIQSFKFPEQEKQKEK